MSGRLLKGRVNFFVLLLLVFILQEAAMKDTRKGMVSTDQNNLMVDNVEGFKAKKAEKVDLQSVNTEQTDTQNVRQEVIQEQSLKKEAITKGMQKQQLQNANGIELKSKERAQIQNIKPVDRTKLLNIKNQYLTDKEKRPQSRGTKGPEFNGKDQLNQEIQPLNDHETVVENPNQQQKLKTHNIIKESKKKLQRGPTAKNIPQSDETFQKDLQNVGQEVTQTIKKDIKHKSLSTQNGQLGNKEKIDELALKIPSEKSKQYLQAVKEQLKNKQKLAADVPAVQDQKKEKSKTGLKNQQTLMQSSSQIQKVPSKTIVDQKKIKEIKRKSPMSIDMTKLQQAIEMDQKQIHKNKESVNNKQTQIKEILDISKTHNKIEASPLTKNKQGQEGTKVVKKIQKSAEKKLQKVQTKQFPKEKIQVIKQSTAQPQKPIKVSEQPVKQEPKKEEKVQPIKTEVPEKPLTDQERKQLEKKRQYNLWKIKTQQQQMKKKEESGQNFFSLKQDVLAKQKGTKPKKQTGPKHFDENGFNFEEEDWNYLFSPQSKPLQVENSQLEEVSAKQPHVVDRKKITDKEFIENTVPYEKIQEKKVLVQSSGLGQKQGLNPWSVVMVLLLVAVIAVLMKRLTMCAQKQNDYENRLNVPSSDSLD